MLLGTLDKGDEVKLICLTEILVYIVNLNDYYIKLNSVVIYNDN